jgi:hypothetical protein
MQSSCLTMQQVELTGMLRCTIAIDFDLLSLDNMWLRAVCSMCVGRRVARDTGEERAPGEPLDSIPSSV